MLTGKKFDPSSPGKSPITGSWAVQAGSLVLSTGISQRCPLLAVQVSLCVLFTVTERPALFMGLGHIKFLAS